MKTNLNKIRFNIYIKYNKLKCKIIITKIYRTKLIYTNNIYNLFLLISDKCYPIFQEDSIEFENFVLKNNGKDNWFLTKNKDIISFEQLEFDEIGKVQNILGKKVVNKTDFYSTPLKSSLLNIFQSDGSLGIVEKISLNDIESKMNCVQDLNMNKIFFPIIHTCYTEIE